MDNNASLKNDPRRIIVELCRRFYTLGWVSGTGGGMGIFQNGRAYVPPSGVQKERLAEEDIFVLDTSGNILSGPESTHRVSACAPLFLRAFRDRGTGAVIHSHGINAMLATLISGDVFEITHIEMIKGIAGLGYHDKLVVPIIENTANEAELVETAAEAMQAHPGSHAVLVRRHGVYIWGDDWVQAKIHAECYHYLFDAAVHMHRMGLDPGRDKPIKR
uniref:Methylthioribulose 1-phosphate dehydratase n=1 Tax=Candidatus Kentrum sp. FW TaxID=2126338 RepID=A0A450U1U1_9GAMM|nr:MAG: methylthioribulose-1-phosphate dehydratase [Candidatus Kentron sp. FW]